MKVNTVFCCKLKQEMPALSKAPLEGPVGQMILANVSQEAYADWLELQIKIINEERLDLSNESAQMRLFEQMITYLDLKDLVE